LTDCRSLLKYTISVEDALKHYEDYDCWFREKVIEGRAAAERVRLSNTRKQVGCSMSVTAALVCFEIVANRREVSSRLRPANPDQPASLWIDHLISSPLRRPEQKSKLDIYIP
jgi:hypothetical protein